MVEISDRVLVAAGLKPGGDPEPPAAAGVVAAFTEADEAPINLD
jgi:hypothetical protein